MKLDFRSIELRKIIIETLGHAKRGHLGPAFSIVEILRVLYDDVMRYKPSEPGWKERDRFILSKGHGCVALYAILADKGFFPEGDLEGLCSIDGKLGGHPEHVTPGVEASTGSLGHGMSIGVGMAVYCQRNHPDSRVYVLLGDGECNEGSVWEAAMSASKHKLENLTVMVDYNKSQAYGPSSEVLDLEPFADKWGSFGFGVREVDGHDVAGLLKTFSETPLKTSKPTAVICHTIKGKGVYFAENNQQWHHKNKISDADIEALIDALGA